MKKILIIVPVLLLVSAFFYIKHRNARPAIQFNSFHEWYSDTYHKTPGRTEPYTDAPTVYTYEYFSPALLIDTIYRSMQGPLSAEQISLSDKNNRLINFLKGPELCWLIGYSVEILDENKQEKLSEDFMCHNNLDVHNKKWMAWNINTIGTFCRIFTLTEGQTDVSYPPGFGYPVLSNEYLVINSQVLNHNLPTMNKRIRHHIKLKYVMEKDLKQPLVPLYQQGAFVTKHVSGPEGYWGEPIHAFNDSSMVKLGSVGMESKLSDSCCTGNMVTAEYDPYHDKQGRVFTGHWKFGPGMETLHTDVTRMLDLKYDTKVHHIGVHLHPFAVSLELRDLTENKTVFKASCKNFSERIGLENIENFESVEGYPVYKDHRYELVSAYDNPTKDVHTAMATMFLALEMK